MSPFLPPKQSVNLFDGTHKARPKTAGFLFVPLGLASRLATGARLSARRLLGLASRLAESDKKAVLVRKIDRLVEKVQYIGE